MIDFNLKKLLNCLAVVVQMEPKRSRLFFSDLVNSLVQIRLVVLLAIKSESGGTTIDFFPEYRKKFKMKTKLIPKKTISFRKFRNVICILPYCFELKQYTHKLCDIHKLN